MTKRFRQRSLDRPAGLQALINRASRQSAEWCPLADRLRHSCVLQTRHIVASVVRLLIPCRPTAILLAVRAICVNPVERVARRRAGSHVSQELTKGLVPWLAYRDASTAVPLIGLMVHVSASGTSLHPGAVLRRVFIPIRATTRQLFSYQAPTTVCDATSKALAAHDMRATAITDTSPARDIDVIRWHSLDNSQSPEPFSDQIDDWPAHTLRIVNQLAV